MLLQFVDRENELGALKKAGDSDKPEFVIIYGRRRIGKTELIKKFMDEYGGFYFLARQQNMELEVKRFREKFGKKYDIFLEGESWEEIFAEIAKKMKDRRIIVVDEFPYWVMKDPSILSEFQYIWDEILKDSKIMLILSGSYVSVMEEKVMGPKSPLYGRRSMQIEVKPMHVRYLRDFLPSYSPEDIIRSFGAVDTIPYYMGQFDPKLDFWGNVERTFMNSSSPMHADAEILLSSELREYNTYFNIIKAIIDGSTKVSEIAKKSRVDITNISKYLRVLQGMKLIKRIKPVSASAKDKNYLYEVEDNYLRFYLTYVYPYREEIEADREAYLEFVKKDYPRYMGRIFEIFVEKSLRDATGMSFSRVGRWWQKEEEIDIVGINEHNRDILFAECKWKKNVDASSILKELKRKAENVRWYDQNRKEHYAIFARSFKRRTKGCMCYDSEDIEKALWSL